MVLQAGVMLNQDLMSLDVDSDLNIKNLKIFFDSNLNFVKEFKLRGVPTTILINKKGEEFARILGDVNFQDKKFIKWLSNYDKL